MSFVIYLVSHAACAACGQECVVIIKSPISSAAKCLYSQLFCVICKVIYVQPVFRHKCGKTARA